jgi:hypothetical protein
MRRCSIHAQGVEMGGIHDPWFGVAAAVQVAVKSGKRVKFR